MWSGETSYDTPPPDNQIWQFSTDGTGGGSWARQTPDDASSFSSLSRPNMGIAAASHDTGFYLGGLLNRGTNQSISGGPFYISGIVSFNMTTGVWANSSSLPFGGGGTDIGGSGQFMPSFGPNGLLIFMGGQSATYTSVGPYIDLYTVTLYDPITKSWYSQNTSGEKPTPRSLFCTVGVQSQNQSFEMYVLLPLL
jgi:hypothetical protein